MQSRMQSKFSKHRSVTITLMIGLLWVGSMPLAQAAKAQIADLNRFVSNLETFSAHFAQTQPEENLFEMNLSEGYFVMQRPGQLLWVYESPDEQRIISDGRNVWVYDVDLDQATVRPLSAVEADFPLSWLIYQEPLSKRFNIIPGDVRNGESWFNLTPKDASFFQSLEVAIADGKMTQIWMYQSPENVTKVKFDNIRQNQSVNIKDFQFTPPKGVDVIGQPVR